MKILIVEDSRFFTNVLEQNIAKKLGIDVIIANTYTQAVDIVESGKEEIFLGLLDLTLPDALSGEIVDYFNRQGIPSVVFSGYFSEEIRENILKNRVIDYVTKDSMSSLDYLIELIERLYNNSRIKALVVDDSIAARKHVGDLLHLQQLQVIEAENAQQALEILRENDDIRLLVTDFNMPGMDGTGLVHEIRKEYARDELVVIGMSTYGNNLISAKFIKSGANDFIHKPFQPEEFLCRVSQNLNMVEHVKRLNDYANQDFLTKLSNRRILIEKGEQLYLEARRGKISLAAALIDIDHFKSVNDTYGHDFGDIAIKRVADLLANRFTRGKNVVARMGGEEYCVLLVDYTQEEAVQAAEEFRRELEHEVIGNDEHQITITASVGVCNRKVDSLETLLNSADEAMYEAKNSGRNMVMCDLQDCQHQDRVAATAVA